ncbi:MAG: hypothetical protein ACLQUY_04725 [Ktedonobacterales bacterium]
MTSPHIPGHESDDIVDMTPTGTPEPNTESDDIVDMTPTGTPEPNTESDDIVDMTPTYSPPGEFDEPVDMTPTDAPKGGEPEETVRKTSAPVPDRGKKEHRAAAPPRAPEQTGEERDDTGSKPPERHWKRVVSALLAVALLLFVGTRVLGHGLDIGPLHLTGGSTGASQPSSAAVTNTPTPVTIGNQKFTTATGPLILLNPGVVRQGTSVGVTGDGFDPGAVVDLTIRRQGSTASLASAAVKADKGGTFSDANLTVPMSLSSGNFVVVASEQNSSLSTQAVGTVAGGSPQVKLGLQVGQPGTVVTVGLHGFAPEETINVYWNTLSGQPLTTFQADGGGGVGQGQLRVPIGAVGDNTFLFVGAKSQSVVAASFLVLQLYPTVKLSSYALKADNLLSFSAKGFGPGERVFVFLNSMNGQPLGVVSADSNGTVNSVPAFVVPYLLKGKQTLVFVGEQSRAEDAVTFTVLPYSPIVEPSTYGGLPGTTITFYVSGFARNEVVHVYADHTKSTMGTMVGCFQTNARGQAGAVGAYLIPGTAQGALGFALVGEKSGGVGVASVNVSAPPDPVQTAPQPAFTCPLDHQNQPTQTPGSGTSTTQPNQAQPAATQP